jgi:hypothetical protein
VLIAWPTEPGPVLGAVQRSLEEEECVGDDIVFGGGE